MDQTTLAFLSQPVWTLARRGESFATEVIDTLRRWVSGGPYDQDVVAAERNGVVILSSTPSSNWHIVLVQHGEARAEIWGIDYGHAHFETSSILDRYAPFVAIKHTLPVIELMADQLEPSMFEVLAEAHSLTRHTMVHHHGFGDHDRRLWRLVRLMKRHRSGALAKRTLSRILEDEWWAHVEAASDHVTRIDGPFPRLATAGALARWYAVDAITDGGMGRIPSRRRGRLGVLPELDPR